MAHPRDPQQAEAASQTCTTEKHARAIALLLVIGAVGGLFEVSNLSWVPKRGVAQSPAVRASKLVLVSSTCARWYHGPWSRARWRRSRTMVLAQAGAPTSSPSLQKPTRVTVRASFNRYNTAPDSAGSPAKATASCTCIGTTKWCILVQQHAAQPCRILQATHLRPTGGLETKRNETTNASPHMFSKSAQPRLGNRLCLRPSSCRVATWKSPRNGLTC